MRSSVYVCLLRLDSFLSTASPPPPAKPHYMFGHCLSFGVCVMHNRKLKDMLRASVLCRSMDEIRSVWHAVEELQEDGILEGTHMLVQEPSLFAANSVLKWTFLRGFITEPAVNKQHQPVLTIPSYKHHNNHHDIELF